MKMIVSFLDLPRSQRKTHKRLVNARRHAKQNILNDFVGTGITMRWTRIADREVDVCEYLLGIEVARDVISNRVELSQGKTVERLLKKFRMEDCKTCNNPMADFLERLGDPVTDYPFRSLVASLKYLGSFTYPDKSLSAKEFSRHQRNLRLTLSKQGSGLYATLRKPGIMG